MQRKKYKFSAKEYLSTDMLIFFIVYINVHCVVKYSMNTTQVLCGIHTYSVRKVCC